MSNEQFLPSRLLFCLFFHKKLLLLSRRPFSSRRSPLSHHFIHCLEVFGTTSSAQSNPPFALKISAIIDSFTPHRRDNPQSPRGNSSLSSPTTTIISAVLTIANTWSIVITSIVITSSCCLPLCLSQLGRGSNSSKPHRHHHYHHPPRHRHRCLTIPQRGCPNTNATITTTTTPRSPRRPTAAPPLLSPPLSPSLA